MKTSLDQVSPHGLRDTLARTVAEYADQSYYVREEHYLKLLDSTEFGESVWDKLNRCVFAILKPDAVSRGLAGPICNWLEGSGYKIEYRDVLWDPQEWQFETLYQYNLTLRNEHNQIGSWWLNRQLYTLGPSVLLFLSLPSDPFDVYRKITQDKGKSDPLKASPGTLRYEFRATNMTMNLFHCSDDPFSSAREFLIYREEQALNDFAASSQAILPRHSLEQMQNLQPKIAFDPDHCARRIAVRLLMANGIDGFEEAFFVGASPETSMRDRLIRAHQLFKRTSAMLDGKDRSVGHTSKADLLRRFLAFPYVRDVEMDKLVKEIQAIDIEISEWEALALVSTCHYVEGEFDSLK